MNPRILVAAGIGLLILIAAVVALTRKDRPNQDRLNDEQANEAAATAAKNPCGTQATYDRIKAELFRQAAQVRKSDQALFDRLSAYASVRVERPVMQSGDEASGEVRCTGRLSLDLPPGLAVVGGRRTLAADLQYVLQPAADGSGDVATLAGADPIIVPLATLTRTGATAAEAAPLAPDQPPVPMSAYPPQSPAEEEPETTPSASARPSFNCRLARTGGEIAVCNDDRLAALDRQMAAQYVHAVSSADTRQRSLLNSTRQSFLRYRDQCPNQACIAETYRGRMREIRDIMRGTWKPER